MTSCLPFALTMSIFEPYYFVNQQRLHVLFSYTQHIHHHHPYLYHHHRPYLYHHHPYRCLPYPPQLLHLTVASVVLHHFMQLTQCMYIVFTL